MISIFSLALALGIATMLMGYFSSAKRYETFIGSLQHGVGYTVGHATFTTAVVSALFYVVLFLGRWAIG
jgi:hypothetical protein